MAGIEIPEGGKLAPQGDYLVLHNVPEHPLAGSTGVVAYHRFVCYEAMHRPSYTHCHLCGYLVPWKSSLYHSGLHVINVDHIDRNTRNNAPANLRPLCYWCNQNRYIADRYPDQWLAWLRIFKDVPPPYRPGMTHICACLGLNGGRNA